MFYRSHAVLARDLLTKKKKIQCTVDVKILSGNLNTDNLPMPQSNGTS